MFPKRLNNMQPKHEKLLNAIAKGRETKAKILERLLKVEKC